MVTESAQRGNAWALYYLGKIYEDKEDGAMALTFYSQAAEHGIVEAQYKTGMLYKKTKSKDGNRVVRKSCRTRISGSTI